MITHKKKEETTLVDAIETLSNIADLQFDREVGIVQPHDLVINNKKFAYRTLHWLHEEKANETIEMVKETFKDILRYLTDFYTEKYAEMNHPQYVEGLKTIMVLVGEAGRKLDKYISLFYSQEHNMKELKEYKLLQEFYLKHIAKKIDEGKISQWILTLAQKRIARGVGTKGKRPLLTKHVYIDLEGVKKDNEYELFFLRKEDGTRFFSPQLIRNIELVSDFGNFLRKENEDDPLRDIANWQDEVASANAENIRRSMRNHIEKFYKTMGPSETKENRLVDLMNKAMIALMMADHVTEAHKGVKKNWGYFRDFQLFLRRSLQSTEYQKFMVHINQPAKQMNLVISLIHFICLALYTQLYGYHEISNRIHELIHKATEGLSHDHKEAFKDTDKLWAKLSGNYAAVSKLLKTHASGPLNKILTVLEEGECHEFDPILQGNLPSRLYSLYCQDNRVLFARWPSPTYQEFIHKAAMNEEFKAFLYGCSHEHIIKKVLLFNFQDRTTWREQARCKIIEDIPNYDSFSKHIEVATLDRDTEFYHQLGSYAQNNHADVFIKNLKEQVGSEDEGYLFPAAVKKELKNFIPEVIKVIHHLFFSNKNILLRENRLNFIEIFSLFLQLKMIDSLEPDIVGFSCKDGLDTTSAVAAELFVFLKLLNQEHLSENDQHHLDFLLYGPCLITRERLMTPDKFNRFVSVIKAIESARDQIGKEHFGKLIQEALSSFYKAPLLKGKIAVEDNKDIF